MADSNQPVIRSRRALPSGRAVVGALLITLAGLGVLMATRLGDDATFQTVVVATNDLGPGTLIEADDVAAVRIRLDESVTSVATSVEQVIGNVTLGPVGRTEFLQRSNLADMLPNNVPSGLAIVSLPVEPERAPASIAPGELVSILATFSENNGADQTALIADRVVVVSFGDDGDEFGANDNVLRVAVDDGQLAANLALAGQTGTISIIGVTGANSIELPELTQRLDSALGESTSP